MRNVLGRARLAALLGNALLGALTIGCGGGETNGSEPEPESVSFGASGNDDTGGGAKNDGGQGGDSDDADAAGGESTLDPTDDDADDEDPARVSFSRDVQPIFATRCTLCHHAKSAININIADPFDPDNGLVGSENTWAIAHPEGGTQILNVAPGDPDASFLLDKVSNPNLDPGTAGAFMPWSPAPLTATEIETLKTWIDTGAQNDDFFVMRVRPILGDPTRLGAAGGKCTYCHYADGAPPNLADPFDPQTGVVNVPALLGGGQMRVLPGAAADSFLVRKVEGNIGASEGKPMPLAFEPLLDAEVETLRQWILQGALAN